VDRIQGQIASDLKSAQSSAIAHHSSLAALETSSISGGGCHLCALILSALQNCSYDDLFGAHEDPPRAPGGSNAPASVRLTYVVDREKQQHEWIVMHCAGRYSILKLTDVPQSSCTDRDFTTSKTLFSMVKTRCADEIDEMDSDIDSPREPESYHYPHGAGLVRQVFQV